jgi:hypothetical protein
VHSDFSDCPANFFRESGSRLGLDVGSAALRDGLVHALGLGNQSVGAAAGPDFLAHAHHGRTRRAEAVALVRLLWGVAALDSTVLLAFLPASGLWAWYQRAKRRKPSLAGVALASMVFVACIAPWTARNYRTFGKFIFMRDNFGAELRLGNGNGADGTWMQYLHPTQDLYAMRQFTAMGELAYIAMRKQQAVDYIKADYLRFAVLCLKRFVYFWDGPPRVAQIWWLAISSKNSLFLASSVLMFWGLGRALRRRKPGAWLLFWLILLYPAIYYVVFPGQRYRASDRTGDCDPGSLLVTDKSGDKIQGARRTAGKDGTSLRQSSYRESCESAGFSFPHQLRVARLTR